MTGNPITLSEPYPDGDKISQNRAAGEPIINRLIREGTAMEQEARA